MKMSDSKFLIIEERILLDYLYIFKKFKKGIYKTGIRFSGICNKQMHNAAETAGCLLLLLCGKFSKFPNLTMNWFQEN